MKKIILFSAAILFAAVTMAQSVVSASVEFSYCFTTNSYDTLTVGCHLPYLWNGKSLSVDGDYTANLTNAHGCDSIAHMHFTTANWNNSTDLGLVEICKGKSYTWTDLSGQKGDTTINTASSFTRVFSNAKGCDSTVTLSTSLVDCVPEGALKGVFSICDNSEGTNVRQVYFSKGNLQYKTGEGYRFAANQYTIIGSYNNANWVDLFTWGSGKDPLRTSIKDADAYVFNDWGNEPIADAGAAGSWFTMKYEEWVWLLQLRTNASALCGLAKVHSQIGYVIFPDGWPVENGNAKLSANMEGGSPFDHSAGHAANNTFSDALWTEVENLGAVFLPTAGYYSSYYTADQGVYWQTKSTGYGSADAFTFNVYSRSVHGSQSKPYPSSVRLVQVKP